MSDKCYSCCTHCRGGGCDKCHQGWECANFCEEYHQGYPLGSYHPIKDSHYGTECSFCKRGWKLGKYDGTSVFLSDK